MYRIKVVLWSISIESHQKREFRWLHPNISQSNGTIVSILVMAIHLTLQSLVFSSDHISHELFIIRFPLFANKFLISEFFVFLFFHIFFSYFFHQSYNNCLYSRFNCIYCQFNAWEQWLRMKFLYRNVCWTALAIPCLPFPVSSSLPVLSKIIKRWLVFRVLYIYRIWREYSRFHWVLRHSMSYGICLTIG